MKNLFVRILDMQINNIKNMAFGEIEFRNRVKIRKDFKIEGADILGIYGPNGSGKTVLVESISILATLFKGKALGEEVKELILKGEEEASIGASFYIEDRIDKYIVRYEVKIATRKGSLIVAQEKLARSCLRQGKWETRTLLEYRHSEKRYLRPYHRFKEIIAKDKNVLIELNRAKELSIREATSFIFSKKLKEILKRAIANTHESNRVINALYNFAKINLHIIRHDKLDDYTVKQLILNTINSNQEKEDMIKNGISADVNVTLEVDYEAFQKRLKQINSVISAIVPGLMIKVHRYSNRLLSGQYTYNDLEIFTIRDGQSISLDIESSGIKKILAVISEIIILYNNPQVCLVIDDFDRGIFEYLFGELLEVISKGAKGQLIFTAHNLRALEVLDKECIVCTTIEPEHRYCRLKNIKKNSNLRDFYLRSILLGGQKEAIYKETSIYEIQLELRKANNEIKN